MRSSIDAMKQLSHDTVSWIMLVVGGGGYVALLVISSDKAAGPVMVMAAIGVFLLFRNELSPKRCRRRRQQAGLCPECAYDLKHDFRTGCSECGWVRG